MRLTARLLWVIFFCYAVVAALLFKNILLPLVPSLHAAQGLLSNDSYDFHLIAAKMAEMIRLNGWDGLHIWNYSTLVKVTVSGNVTVLASLYALFGNDSSLIIPINATLHATGGVLIFLLACELAPGKVGRYGGVIAAALFVTFPSALAWYSQPLKDSYSITGVLLILYGWIRLISQPSNLKAAVFSILSTIVGMCLVAFVRPYYIKILFVASILCGIVLLIYYAIRPSESKGNWKVLAYLLVSVLILGWGVKYIHSENANLDGYAANVLMSVPILAGGSKYIYADNATQYGTDASANSMAGFQKSNERKKIGSQWQWQYSTWLPFSIEKYVAMVASLRVCQLDYNVELGDTSVIDKNAAPRNTAEVVAYMPRALQIGLFAPFPSKWFQKLSAMRMVAVIEMGVWYVAACGILLALYYLRSPGLFVAIVFSLFIIGTLSFSTPNVGSLYRYRYAYLFVLLLIGVLGWTHFFLQRKKDRCNEPTILPDPVPENIERRE